MTQAIAQSYKANILIVDDLPTNLRLLTAMLKSQGYNVRPALNGQLAIAAAQSAPPDLILLDIMMPDMDGYEVCRQLKADEITQNIPVIFLSALDETVDKLKAFAAGGSDYITKPFQKAEVLARIENQLQLYSLQNQLAEQNNQLHQFGENLKQLHRLNTQTYHNFVEIFNDYLITGCLILGFSEGTVSRIEGQMYHIEAWHSCGEVTCPAAVLPLADTYCEAVLEAQKTITYTQIGQQEELKNHPFYQQFQAEAYIGTPIWVNNTIYGTLSFTDPTPKTYESQEIEVIELMAQSLGKFLASHQAEIQRRKAEEEIQLLLEIIQGISQSANFEEALAVALQEVCEKTGWVYGEAWVETRDRTALECSRSWYCQDPKLIEFRQYSEALIFLPGEELPGRVWEIQQSEWVADIAQEEDDPFLRLDYARKSGLQAALAVPILTTENLAQQETEVLAVLVFFMPQSREKEQRLSHLVTVVAAQLGKMMQQKQVETEQKAMFSAMTDGVMVFDITGVCLRVAPTNSVHRLSMENMRGKTLPQIFPRDTAERLLNCIQESLASRKTQTLEYSVVIDDQQVWFDGSISPLNEEMAIAVVRDISDRKKAQDALQQSEARNRAILAAIPDLMFRMSAEGIYLDQIKSRQLKDIVTPEANPVGKHISQLVPLEIAKKQLVYAHKALETGEPQVYEQEVWVNQKIQYEEVRVVVSGPDEVLFMVRDNSDRKRAELGLRLAKQQSERLLLNILPRPIAERLKKTTGSIAEQYDHVTILFADIVGFTPLSANLTPIELVNFLNEIFSTFDRLAQEYNLEKIKTIGDAYMVVGGLPEPDPNHIHSIATMALAMQDAIANIISPQPEYALKMRVGIHTGSAVAGVIGVKKFIYDLWGDTVNVASRMESQGIPGKIQVTTPVYEALQNDYILEERGSINIKGRGEMTTYWLLGHR